MVYWYKIVRKYETALYHILCIQSHYVLCRLRSSQYVVLVTLRIGFIGCDVVMLHKHLLITVIIKIVIMILTDKVNGLCKPLEHPVTVLPANWLIIIHIYAFFASTLG